MEPEGSDPHSQQLSPCPSPGLDKFSSHHPILSLHDPTHLRHGIPSGLFPSGFFTNKIYASLFSPSHTTCRVHHILLDLIILIVLGKEYESQSSLLCSFLQHPIASSLFGPNILLSNLFSNTLSWYSFLNVRDQVSHPYSTTGRIIVLHILMLKLPWLMPVRRLV
jgi:hypothetical protein